VRRLALPTFIAAVALLVCACGGSAIQVHTTRKKSVTAHRADPTFVSAAVIAKAAKLTAAEPGFALDVTGNATISGLQGKVSFSGSGAFNATGGGDLHVSVDLPGLFSLVSPIKTQVVVAGSNVYAELPQSLLSELGTSIPWVFVSLSEAGQELGLPADALATGFAPRTLLNLVAADSTGKADAEGSAQVNGQSTTLYKEELPALGDSDWLDAWVDPNTGLLSQLQFTYARTGRGQLTATISFTGFGAQALPPTPSGALSLSQVLSKLGL
jgi:hypothetical protein